MPARVHPTMIRARPISPQVLGKISATKKIVDISSIVIVKKNVPIRGGFFATITYAAIILTEHYYDKRYNPMTG
jgi:hypothetical protein